MAPRDLIIRTRRFDIRYDAELFQEARELASIFAKAVSTARKNTERTKNNPKS